MPQTQPAPKHFDWMLKHRPPGLIREKIPLAPMYLRDDGPFKQTLTEDPGPLGEAPQPPHDNGGKHFADAIERILKMIRNGGF